MEIVLYKPEIAGNVGAIIRLAANSAIPLHIVGELNFSFEDKKVKRAGLDYHDLANVSYHNEWNEFSNNYLYDNVFVTSSMSNNIYWEKDLTKAKFIIFGSESIGLPKNILTEYKDNNIKIPMDSNSRSINLANAVSIITYEYLRQISKQS
jgi:tRNA (cytidine/uridine-2'-O-)-methyltransferase